MKLFQKLISRIKGFFKRKKKLEERIKELEEEVRSAYLKGKTEGKMEVIKKFGNVTLGMGAKKIKPNYKD